MPNFMLLSLSERFLHILAPICLTNCHFLLKVTFIFALYCHGCSKFGSGPGGRILKLYCDHRLLYGSSWHLSLASLGFRWPSILSEVHCVYHHSLHLRLPTSSLVIYLYLLIPVVCKPLSHPCCPRSHHILCPRYCCCRPPRVLM